MTASTDNQRFYYPELDGLRFVAFMLVFIHNAPTIELGPIWKALHEYGWIGVDLFFCLSGYLITRLLITEHHLTGKINTSNFYIRRLLRIGPLYWFYLVIAILFIVEDQGWNPIIQNHLVGLTTFTYNFVYLFLTHKIYIILAHLWTISYEAQFYFSMPLIIQRLVSSKKKSISLALFVVFIVGSLIRAALIFYRIKHPAIYMLPFTHFEAILGGMVLGLGLLNEPLKKIPGWVLLSLGLLSNAVVFFLPNTYDIQPGLMLSYPLAGSGMTLIVFAVTRKDRLLLPNIFRNKSLVYLGRISYGLYIYHLLSISLVDWVLTKLLSLAVQELAYYPMILFLAGLLVTVGLSMASFHIIETPFLKLKQGFTSVMSRPV